MYERFTDRAREVLNLARNEAWDEVYVGTQHILLAMVKEGRGVAARVLTDLDIDAPKIRREVAKLIPSPQNEGGGVFVQTPWASSLMGRWRRFIRVARIRRMLWWTPSAKNVIQFAWEEAQRRNQDYVGTEHILLGLLREQETVAVQVLVNLGFGSEQIRAKVMNLFCEDEGKSG